jgi:hypothetical protein
MGPILCFVVFAGAMVWGVVDMHNRRGYLKPGEVIFLLMWGVPLVLFVWVTIGALASMR